MRGLSLRQCSGRGCAPGTCLSQPGGRSSSLPLATDLMACLYWNI